MKKNLFKRALTLALCATTAFSIVGCGGGGGGGGDDSSGPADKIVDANKTQLSFYFYNSGYGDKWPYELAALFEEYVNEKGISFEEDKVGVQVHPKAEKNDVTAQQIKRGDYDLYFLEGASDYNNMLASKAFEPLDDIVTTVSNYDNRKIEDKMTDQQKSFYKYKKDENDEGHYYTLPHYAGNYSIIYNVELFDQYGFYIAETPDEDNGDIFVGPGRETKSAGPNGKKGDYDDGLPATYYEFFELCKYIHQNGVDPVCFPGMYAGQHVGMVMESLAATYEGAEQWELNYSFTGTAKNLIEVDSNGKPVLQNGQPKFVGDTEITPDNAYLLSRQAGYYYAMNFMETLLGNTNYYNEEDGQNTAFTHKMMEQGFLEYGKLGIKESAMLFDGTWWQMDAASTFDRMAKEDAKWSKENRKFGLMPLPQPTAEEAAKVANGEKKAVFTDILMACSGIKAGLPEGKKAAAKAFLQFIYSDQAMAEFTYSTGAPVGMDYLDTIDETKLNPWEKSVITYMKDADIVYGCSSTPLYKQYMSMFRFTNKYKTTLGTVETAIWSKGYQAGDYFKAYQTQFKGIAWATK